MHDAAHRLRQHVLAALMRVGSFQPEAGADGVDDARVDPAQLLVAESHALHDAGAEIVDDDVRGLDQLNTSARVLVLAQVERHGALVAVERAEDRTDESRRIVRERGARQVARRRPLDLDDVGSVVREHLRRDRAHHHLGEVDDAHAVERQRRRRWTGSRGFLQNLGVR